MSSYTDINGFSALAHYGLIKVGGEDASGFLQGQLTCDVNALTPGGSCLGAQCNPKGRVIANFHLLRGERDFYLLLAADLAPVARKRLQMYVLRSKVALDDLTPGRAMIGLFGTGYASGLAALGIDIPDSPGAVLERPGCLVFRLADGTGRCLIAADVELAQRMESSLRGALALADPNLWRLAGIEAGIPEITAAASEEFLPQMLNLDALGGIGFQKGCYTGQEIVTRTHFLGQLKRRMFRLRCRSETEPAPGTLIYDAGEAEPRNVGQVVAAAAEVPDGYQLLAVMGVDHDLGGDYRLLRPDGPKTEFLPLPYTCGGHSL